MKARKVLFYDIMMGGAVRLHHAALLPAVLQAGLGEDTRRNLREASVAAE